MTTKESMLWGLDQNSKAEGNHERKTVRGTERIMELKLLLECEREVVGGPTNLGDRAERGDQHPM